MIGKLFLFGLCAVAFAQENADLASLEKLTTAGKTRVGQTVSKLDAAPGEFTKLTEERVGCLVWEVTTQKEATNKTIAEAIFKGMLKNKQFNNFQCVSKASQETFEKLDVITPQIPAMSEKIREKGLAPVRAFGLILSGFSKYCDDLYKQKAEELKKAADQAAKDKIVKEVANKMTLLQTLMGEVDKFLESAKFKFLEEHIMFAHQLENNIRKVQREGAQKIVKCVN